MNDAALFKILDVVMVDRENRNLQTTNKSCYVLSCRISGESTFTQNGKKLFIAKQGDVLYIPYGSSYKQSCKREKVICIHLEAFSAAPSNIMLFSTNDPKYVCSLFFKCYNAFKKRENNFEYTCMSVLYEILSVVSFDSLNSVTANNSPFNLAMQYLSTHVFEQDFSVDALCENANISRTYFNKKFKEAYNTTPIKHINNLRTNKAKLLLKSGNYTNEEVAALCGFSDVKYFYVIFKKLTGQTTLEYKKTEHPTD